MQAIAHTKIALPHRRSELLTRQRIIEMIQGFLDHKLIAIIAPAGYGKTSALIDFADHTNVPVCWYAADALDNDPQRFITYFIAAIQHRFPEFGKQSSAILETITTFDEKTLDQLATVITNEMHTTISEHFLTILDDYHFVNNNDVIRQFVNRLLVLADDKFHLAVSSRTIINLDFVLFVSRNQARGFGMQQLAFTVDELQKMALQAYHLTLSEHDAQKLIEKTEGWPTGLALSIQAQWGGMTDRLSLPAGLRPGIELHTYLAQQVFNQQDVAIQNFLLKTSLLEEFNADLCERVLGEGDWATLMANATQSNLFLLSVDSSNNPTLRYHHLFGDFLQHQIALEQPAEREAILRRLAEVYIEREMWEKAHNIYFDKLKDVQATAKLLSSIGLALLDAGRLTTLATWLDALPSTTLNVDPALLSLRGYVAVTLNQPQQGLELLNRAVAAFRPTKDIAQLGRALIRRAVAHRFLANYQDALNDVEEVLNLTEATPSHYSLVAEAFRSKGVVLNRLGQLKNAIKWLEQSKEMYRQIQDLENIAVVNVELGSFYDNIGCYDSAEHVYYEALRYWQNKKNWPRQAVLLNNLGVIHYRKGDYLQALTLLEESFECAKKSSYVRMEAFALVSIGDLYMDLDAPEQALEAYHRARPNTDRYYLNIYLDLAEAAIEQSQYNFKQAHRSLSSAKQNIQKNNSNYEQGLYLLAEGHLALAEKNFSQALTSLESAQHIFIKNEYRVETITVHFRLARLFQEMGNQTAVFEHLQQALEQAAELGSQHPLIVAAIDSKDLLKKAQQTNPSISDQIVSLLNEIKQFERNIPKLRRQVRQNASIIPFAPPQLRIQVLGKTQIEINNKIVPNNAWKALVARDLFLFLLNHHQGATKEMIGLNFWPNHSPAQLDMQFKKTMYRLRQTLGRDVILFNTATDRYMFNNNLDYEYDVQTFWAESERANSITSLDERISAYEATLRIYQGSFLSDIDGSEWIWFKRERLSNHYISMNLQLINLYLETGKYYQALKYCEQTLVEDPYNEAIYRKAMRAYAALGNKAGVIHQFKRCQKLLLEEVGAPVSPQTEALLQTIT